MTILIFLLPESFKKKNPSTDLEQNTQIIYN